LFFFGIVRFKIGKRNPDFGFFGEGETKVPRFALSGRMARRRAPPAFLPGSGSLLEAADISMSRRLPRDHNSFPRGMVGLSLDIESQLLNDLKNFIGFKF
jgi:hypothetical protein